MRTCRSGIGTTVAVVAVVAIIAVAAGAYYLVTLPKGSSNATTPPTTSSSSTTTSTASSSQSPSTTSSSTGGKYTYPTSTATTCTGTTMSTMTGPSSFASLNFSAYFNAYSEMKVRFNGTYSGTTYDITADYHVLSVSKTTYKVNVTNTVSGVSTPSKYTVWVLKNGTATAVFTSGTNYTKPYASTFFFAAMAAYLWESIFTNPQAFAAMTSSMFTHSTGSSNVMLGPTSVTVTNYVANNLPLNINQCGFTASFTKFFLQTGAVSGVNVPLLTSMTLSGTFGSGGSSQSVSLSFKMESLTKA